MCLRQTAIFLGVLFASAMLSAADDCKDMVSVCAVDPDLCEDLDYATNVCPKFCNICSSTPSNKTTTKPGNGTTPKPGRTTHTTQRPASCSGSCKDTIDNCRDYLDLCNNPSYTSMLNQKCACSCHFCSSSTCADANPHCADWAKHGFCTSHDYSEATKKAYCAKTCKLC